MKKLFSRFKNQTGNNPINNSKKCKNKQLHTQTQSSNTKTKQFLAVRLFQE